MSIFKKQKPPVYRAVEDMRYMRENKVKMTRNIWRMLEMCDGQHIRATASGQRIVIGTDSRPYHPDAMLGRKWRKIEYTSYTNKKIAHMLAHVEGDNK